MLKVHLHFLLTYLSLGKVISEKYVFKNEDLKKKFKCETRFYFFVLKALNMIYLELSIVVFYTVISVVFFFFVRVVI